MLMSCYRQLALEFLAAAGNLRVAWNIVGLGMRAGQDIGIHRFGMCTQTIMDEQELETRASW
jgi:hypothetical protein